MAKQSWRCPQRRKSYQEGTRSKAWRNELQTHVNPVCTCLWPDPELAFPEGVNGIHLERLGRHQVRHLAENCSVQSHTPAPRAAGCLVW